MADKPVADMQGTRLSIAVDLRSLPRDERPRSRGLLAAEPIH